MKYITAFSRIFVGVLFIISGLIKANDALGFSYKLDEYFTVFNTPWFSHISIGLAMFLCVLEIALGVALLVGWQRKLVLWLLFLLIVFFSFLTFYSAYFNVVKDCGCFGDALHLRPWQSFGKDMILLFFILILIAGRNFIKPLFPKALNSIVVYGSTLLSFWFTWHCYAHLPVKDFRPYAIGKNIPEGMVLPPGAITDSIQVVFEYKSKKDGKNYEFDMNKLPEDLDSYEFVDRKDKVIREGDKPHIHDFTIKDADDVEHVEEFMNNPDYSFMLVAYELKKTNKDVQKKINEFVAECDKKKVQFFGMTATPAEETDIFRHENQSMFQYYFCDATTLKTIIRSNPGLVLLKKGTVIDMWHYNDFPSFEDVNKKYLKR